MSINNFSLLLFIYFFVFIIRSESKSHNDYKSKSAIYNKVKASKSSGNSKSKKTDKKTYSPTLFPTLQPTPRVNVTSKASNEQLAGLNSQKIGTGTADSNNKNLNPIKSDSINIDQISSITSPIDNFSFSSFTTKHYIVMGMVIMITVAVYTTLKKYKQIYLSDRIGANMRQIDVELISDDECNPFIGKRVIRNYQDGEF